MLKHIFKKSNKCPNPEEIPIEKIQSVELDGKTCKFLFTIPGDQAFTRISKLPIILYKIELSQIRTEDAIKRSKTQTPPTLKFKISANLSFNFLGID